MEWDSVEFLQNFSLNSLKLFTPEGSSHTEALKQHLELTFFLDRATYLISTVANIMRCIFMLTLRAWLTIIIQSWMYKKA